MKDCINKIHGIKNCLDCIDYNYPCAINEYQMFINVTKTSGGDVDCNNHCNDDFGDIRFVDVDNSTYLDYWIEKKIDGSFAWFWVELPSDDEIDQKILELLSKNSRA